MNTLPRWLIATAAMFLLALAGGGTWLYRTQEQDVRRNAEANLASIARLKVLEIVQWRGERRGDAAVFTQSPSIAGAVEQWMAQPGPETVGRIVAEFQSLQSNYHYRDILLLDARGQVRMSMTGRTGALPPTLVDAVAAAFRTRQPVFTDLHNETGASSATGEVIAPLFRRNPAAAVQEPLAAIVLQIDARDFLYPVTQSWPTPSRTAETLFVRRDGDAVLYLNELRRQPDAAFHLRIPLARREVPAVMAVLGRRGVVEGVDYGGVEVLAALEAIPDSPWFLIAKMDATEALAEWRFRALVIVVMLLLLAAALAGALGLIWEQQSRFRALSRSADALREREERLRDTMDLNQKLVGAAPIGILAFDADGSNILANEAAPKIIGATAEQVRSHNFRQIESWRNSGLLEAADRALDNGQDQRAEIHMVTTFNREIWLDCALDHPGLRATAGGACC
jgi:two-component system cell cycle sensor histidine kinase/response regulator CckA